MNSLWLAATVAVSIVLGACGSAPTVRQQKVFEVNAAKMERVLFFYQDTLLRQTSSHQTGNLPISASPGETGLYRFGEALVKRGPQAFSRYGVTVEHASVVPPGEWRAESSRVFAEYGPSKLRSATVVVITPLGGSTTANLHVARVNLSFEVRVIDGRSAKLAWIGQVDTSTFKGRDFIMRNVSGRELDEAYADEFVALIADSLKGAGLL